MNNRDNILQSIELIEDKLKEDISVFSISKEIGYSLYHFSRLFQAITGHSPKDYIQRRRLSEAAKEITDSNRKLIDIAFDYQFNDYETFSRAFKRVLRLNPNDVRKNKSKRLILLSKLTHEDIYHIEKIKDLKPQILELNTIYLVGMSTLIKGSTRIITDLWSKLDKEITEIKNKKTPEKLYELHYWSEKHDLNGFFVMCGIETKHLDSISTVLSGKVIPPARYLKFIHKGKSCHVGLTYKYIFQTWLPKSNYKLGIPYEFEYYGDKYLGPNHDQSESEIYIPIEYL